LSVSLDVQIRHAVLNNLESKTASNARFYLKKTSTKDDDSRLTQLKGELKQTSQLKVKDYESPSNLAAAVLKDFTELLDQEFPLRDIPTPLGSYNQALVVTSPDLTLLFRLEREQMAHLAFQESRARVYIGRQNYFQAINSHLITPGSGPMVIVGESGSGKVRKPPLGVSSTHRLTVACLSSPLLCATGQHVTRKNTPSV